MARRGLPWFVALAPLLACSGPRPAAGPGKPVRIAVPYELGTLDPHVEDRLSSFAILFNVYEPLVTLDGDMRVRPGLAGTWENPDPLTWVFRLRPSVTFHGGRPLRAADAAYSLNRVLRDPGLEIRNYLVNVVEVAADNDLALKVRTSVPSRIFLNKLSNVMIVPEGAGAEALRAAADGTGPYTLAGWRPGESVRLERNDRYWGGPPAVAEVEFVLGRGPEEAIEGLVSGAYQLVLCNSKKVESAVAGSQRHKMVRGNNLYVKYLGWDLSRTLTPFCTATPNPFRDVRVRRAIGLAIDRRRLVAGLPSYAVPASQPVPRFVFGFNPEIAEPIHDLEGAKALLREAGYGKGFGVVLHARRVLSEAAALVKEDLGEIGIGVEVRVVPDAEFFTLLGRREATLWLNRWGCSSGDASDFLESVVHSPDRARNFGLINYGGYANRELDRAIEASAAIEKPEARRNAVQEIIATIVREHVLLPLYNDQDVYALDASLSWQPRSDSNIQAADIVPRR